MYLSPLPRPQPTRGRAAVTWPYLLHCSPPSPPPLNLLIRSPAPPFFHPLPTPSNRSQAPLGLFFFFLIQDANSSPVSKSTVKLFSCKRRKAGWGGSRSKKGEGGGRERGTEEGRDIPPQSWVWRRAGKQEVRCPAPRPAGPPPRPPPAPPVPPGAALGRAQAAWRIVRNLPSGALPTLFVRSACA